MMQKRVRRDGIWIDEKNYFSHELVFEHLGEVVNVEIVENVIYVKSLEDTTISTFNKKN